METWQKASEDEKDQPPKEALEKSRDGARGVDEGSAGVEDNRPVEEARPRLRRSKPKEEDPKPKPPEDPKPKPKPKPLPPPPPEHQQPAAQRSQSSQTIINVLGESIDTREETEEAQKLAEEIKNILQFAYFSTGMAGAAILGYHSGFISNQKEQTESIYAKICIVLIIATIVSGVSMILIAFLHPRNRVSFKIIKYLKYGTLGLLTMATFGASILLLKVYALLAFFPVMVVVMVAFIRASWDDKAS